MLVHHQRFPNPGYVSVERLFDQVRRHLPASAGCQMAVSPLPSRGLWPRLVNLHAARRARGEINHITGDVHYLAFGLPRRGLVLTVLDCVNLNRLKGVRRAVFKKLWYSGPMRQAQIITTISHAIKAELQTWVGVLADRTVVVPACVGPEFSFEPKPFSQSEPLWLQVGTNSNKNLERVAAALSGVAGRLEIVGQLSSSQRQILAEHRVRYSELGQISDAALLEAYRRCDALVFASLYEGFGMPIIEAQALGRPVITSDRGATREVAGTGALLVDPESIGSIRGAITQLVSSSSLRERLIDEGLQNARRFRPQTVADQYLALYQQLGLRDHEMARG